jgi:predicted DNA-binding transcriptional regulator AlpA
MATPSPLKSRGNALPRLESARECHPLRLFRPTRLARLLGVDPSTIWRWRKTGVLPPPVEIGGIIGWTEEMLRDVLHNVGVRHD